MPGSYFTLALSATLYYISVFTASPLWWNRAFLSVSQTACEGTSVSSKADKDSAGTWCYSTVTASPPLPAAVFSQFHNPWEDEEGCVGWGTLMSQEAFCSWACDWLYGHSVLCSYWTKWKVLLGFARMLRGSWSVRWAAWVGSQPAWSILRCKHSIKRRSGQKIYLTCLWAELCTFSGALFASGDPWVLLKGRYSFW